MSPKDIYAALTLEEEVDFFVCIVYSTDSAVLQRRKR